jgi:hypothetical protein
LFTTGYKSLAEGGWETFGFWFFGCGRLLEGRIAGERFLKGENELKGGLLKGK